MLEGRSPYPANALLNQSNKTDNLKGNLKGDRYNLKKGDRSTVLALYSTNCWWA